MGDQTWVDYYEPESKRQSMEWWHTSSPPKKTFKSAPSARKLMLALFWDMTWPVLKHCQEKGETVNSVRSGRETVVCNLHSTSWTLSKGFLLHGNARPHTAAATVTPIQKVKFETINPPPTVQTLSHLTIMCLAHLIKHCNDEDFRATTRWRRQCISDFENNNKLFFYLNSELYLSILLH
jgi:hypothetical protein